MYGTTRPRDIKTRGEAQTEILAHVPPQIALRRTGPHGLLHASLTCVAFAGGHDRGLAAILASAELHAPEGSVSSWALCEKLKKQRE